MRDSITWSAHGDNSAALPPSSSSGRGGAEEESAVRGSAFPPFTTLLHDDLIEQALSLLPSPKDLVAAALACRRLKGLAVRRGQGRVCV